MLDRLGGAALVIVMDEVRISALGPQLYCLKRIEAMAGKFPGK
jgi:hypothetical protein